jgi:choline-glycine betaine transporter
MTYRFSVAEPLSHYMQPPVGVGQTYEAARQSMVWTLFHYGLTGWCIPKIVPITAAVSTLCPIAPLILCPKIG